VVDSSHIPVETLPAEEQCWIRTDLAGFITDAEQICQRLLNLTLRGARGKELLPFFVRNRFDIAGEMRGVLRTGVGSRRISAEFMPRDRRRASVEVSISKPNAQTLEWQFWLTGR